MGEAKIKKLNGLVNPNPIPKMNNIKMAVWGATPYVITGFGCVMKEMLHGLYRQYPGIYDIYQVGINFTGDYCDEFLVTGGPQNGRYRQWPATVQLANGQRNLYGQPKFLELLRGLNVDLDVIFLAEDPFWIGGNIPGHPQQVPFVDLIRMELQKKGLGHVPLVCYFPIDGIPKKSWTDNIAKYDFPLTYLQFGLEHCTSLTPSLHGRLSAIPLGVNDREFYPIDKQEARLFKRAMFGDAFADKFMFLNVNRNQLRKMLPSCLLAFREFKKIVPDSFVFMNMQPIDVGWNLIEVCNSLGLHIGQDVLFPPDFNVNKGLSIEDLNKLFNSADVLFSTAIGGGWELALSQAFATKTTVLAPANTSHVELCGDQTDPSKRRGVLFNSGACLSQQVILPYDNEVLRPMPDVDDMVIKMKWIYDNPEECNKIKENAYIWTKEKLSWTKNIVPEFHKLFSIAKKIKLDRQKPTSNL